MATKNMAYDHPAYLAVRGESAGEVGGAATTAYGKFASFTAQILRSVQVTVTTAGTASSACTIYRIAAGGTTTTSIGSYAMSTSAIGTTSNVLISNGSLALTKGDVLYIASGADATGKQAVAYELQLVPGADVTA